MAYAIRVTYRLSDRGRREAMKAGLEPNELQTQFLTPDTEGYGTFADFVDLDAAASEWDEEAGEVFWFIPYTVGEPFGYSVSGPDTGNPDDYLWLISPTPIGGTEISFDKLMTPAELAEAESKHQVNRRLAYQKTEEQMEGRRQKFDAAIAERVARKQQEIQAWLELNSKWNKLPQVIRLERASKEWGDTYTYWDEDEVMELFGKAIEAVVLQEAYVEAKEWIPVHGSRRIKLILGENMLHTSMNVYREERIAKEFPSWSFLKKPIPAHQLTVPLNPTEEILEKLVSARKHFPSAKLFWDKDAKEPLILAEFLDKPVSYSLSAYDDDIPF